MSRIIMNLIDKGWLLLYPTPMDQPFLFPQNEKWDNFQSFVADSKHDPLSSSHRLLLTGGGTLTTTLHALLRTPVHISVIRQEFIESDQNLLHFLELKQTEKGLSREVWILNDKNKKLVYASSFLPLNGLNPSLYEAFLSRKHSIGDLLETMKLPSFKDKFGFGSLQSEFLSHEFQCPKDSLLWYRHFRLSAPQHLLASIYEVFSPRLFEI